MARMLEVPNAQSFGSFKPHEHSGDVAFIVLPKQFRQGVETKFGAKDFMDCDVYSFETMTHVQSGKPVEHINVSFSNAGLLRSLRGSEGVVMGPWRFTQKDTGKGNPAWLFEPVRPGETGFDEANAFADALDARLNGSVPPAPGF